MLIFYNIKKWSVSFRFRELNVRGHFYLLISLRRRALFEVIRKYSNFKATMNGYLLYQIMSKENNF